MAGDGSLIGSWAVVLGASSGIGVACAVALAEVGADIIGVALGRRQRDQRRWRREHYRVTRTIAPG